MDERVRRALVGLLRFLLKGSEWRIESVICAPCPNCGCVIEIVEGRVLQNWDEGYGEYRDTYPCQEVGE